MPLTPRSTKRVKKHLQPHKVGRCFEHARVILLSAGALRTSVRRNLEHVHGGESELTRVEGKGKGGGIVIHRDVQLVIAIHSGESNKITEREKSFRKMVQSTQMYESE